jgi:hypothetical protein
MRYITLIFTLFFVYSAFSQESDTNSYRNKVVLYSDLGFKAAPFRIQDNFPNGVKSLHFKHNFKPSLGLGVAYKWFALRIGMGLPVLLRNEKKFGSTNITDAGLKFNIKQTFWDIDFRVYRGFAIKDAYKYNDTLDKNSNPHDIRDGTAVASFSINNWYFKNKQYKMKSVFGISGDFKRTTGSWFYKSGLAIFGVGNDSLDLVGGRSIIPNELTDSSETRSLASSAFSFDLQFVPGYAYTYKQDNFQLSVFGGLGAAIQAKSWNVKKLTRGFLGIAPRVDLRFIAGYSKPKYFFWFVTDFDIKSLSFLEMKYNQTYYTLQVMGGIRLDKKQKEKKRSKRKDSRLP